MTKVIKFKKDCPGFIDKNYRDFLKPSFCLHYQMNGECAFFHNDIGECVVCDEVIIDGTN